MLKIKAKTKPAIPEKQLFEVDGQEFETKEAAEAYALELATKVESRKKDYLIAEKLFGWIWCHRYGETFLVDPVCRDGYWDRQWEETLKPASEWNVNYLKFGINISMVVPKFEEHFEKLYWQLILKDYFITYDKQGDSYYAYIKKYCYIEKDMITVSGHFLKKYDSWHDIYCYQNALKEAAFKLAQTL